MPYGRINIFFQLLVLVFSLNHVRSDDYNNLGVDDDVGVDDQAADVPVDDYGAIGDDDAVADEEAVDDESNIVEADNVQVEDTAKDNSIHAATPCTVQGTHYRDDCNICYCYKSNAQACTNTDCNKQSLKVLSANPAKRLSFNKLRNLATGCVPGEKIKTEKCECSCAIPSVLTCPDKCL